MSLEILLLKLLPYLPGANELSWSWKCCLWCHCFQFCANIDVTIINQLSQWPSLSRFHDNKDKNMNNDNGNKKCIYFSLGECYFTTTATISTTSKYSRWVGTIMLLVYFMFIFTTFVFLPHWGQNKMPAILQTTFSTSFCRIETTIFLLNFLLKCYWNFIPRVQLTIG